MNKKLFFTGLLALGMITGYAQPNFGKIKSKAGDVIKKDDKGSDKKEDKSTGVGTSGKGVESSPAAASIRNYRNALSFAQDAVKGKSRDAGDRIEKLKPMLDKIKQEDPNWAEYSKDETAYLELKKQYEADQVSAGRKSRLEAMDNAAFMIGKEPWRYNDYAAKLDRKVYEAIKKENEGVTLNEYENKAMTNINDFYNNKMVEVKKQAQKQIKEKTESNPLFFKESRVKADYMDRFHLNTEPRYTIDNLTEALKRCENALLMMPDDAELQAAKTKMTADKADIEQYVSSGEYNKHVEIKKQMIIDATLCGKALASDASLNAIVKRDMDSDNGTIYRISITSRDWDVIKNDYDIPTRKTRSVDVVMKKDGKCYLNSGWLTCTYEGGGRYGAPSFENGQNLEMNCKNVDK